MPPYHFTPHIMNITLIGFGKMGRIIAELATERGHNIVSTIDPANPHASYQKITEESLKNTDVCIDFSHATAVKNTVEQCIAFGKNLVLGTTGWYNQLPEIKETISKSGIGVITSPNFSLGVNVFLKMLANASEIINHFDEYDVLVNEWHHRHKKDSPSGTALAIGNLLLKHIERKKMLVSEKLDRAPEPHEIHLTSTRGGEIPGTHSVFFDSGADTIDITHTARNRTGFALGAIHCAEWIVGKKGFFTMEDWMEDVIKRK